jgi:hypothetical protein
MLGSLPGGRVQGVVQVDERQYHPGPGSGGTGIGEPGGELLDMAAQLGQRLIGEPEGAAVQVDLAAGQRPVLNYLDQSRLLQLAGVVIETVSGQPGAVG